MTKLRVMYILWHYPQLSEQYIETEIEALSAEFDIRVIARTALQDYHASYKTFLPFKTIVDAESVLEEIREFRPDVLHTHWLINIAGLFELSRRAAVPFTVRAHSFDTIDSPDPRMQPWLRRAKTQLREASRDDLCLGIVAFPFSRRFLQERGVRSQKIHDCFPVINYARFFDPSPNGTAVMNTGACIPKKKMADFVKLGRSMHDQTFNLYPVSYNVEAIKRYNKRLGNPINIRDTVEPYQMPAVYKRHRWLVYTADPLRRNVGWPVSVAEAQASGVGVLMANIRPDVREYVGEGGFVYDSLSEARKILRQPFPDELREKGFSQARKSDIQEHKGILTSIWAQS
ncbi:MAG: hypothetical protein QNK18_12830 [Gammaproteobacteria bacterium]|nr:hypothetical protein [Gammaproteobacteria bacterium]